MVNITQSVPVFRYPYKIALVEPLAPLFPGVPYPVTVTLKDHYGDPLENPRTLRIIAYYNGDPTDGRQTVRVSVDDSGSATLYLDIPEDALELTLEVIMGGNLSNLFWKCIN